jgi:hypothetical protein
MPAYSAVRLIRILGLMRVPYERSGMRSARGGAIKSRYAAAVKITRIREDFPLENGLIFIRIEQKSEGYFFPLRRGGR